MAIRYKWKGIETMKTKTVWVMVRFIQYREIAVQVEDDGAHQPSERAIDKLVNTPPSKRLGPGALSKWEYEVTRE